MESRITGFEHYARTNFLYQAAINVFQVNPKLSQFYISEMRQVCEKIVIRLDKGIKKNFCKKCSFLLVFLPKDVKCEFYLGVGNKEYVCVKCPECGYEKRVFNRRLNNSC